MLLVHSHTEPARAACGGEATGEGTHGPAVTSPAVSTWGVAAPGELGLLPI